MKVEHLDMQTAEGAAPAKGSQSKLSTEGTTEANHVMLIPE